MVVNDPTPSLVLMGLPVVTRMVKMQGVWGPNNRQRFALLVLSMSIMRRPQVAALGAQRTIPRLKTISASLNVGVILGRERSSSTYPPGSLFLTKNMSPRIRCCAICGWIIYDDDESVSWMNQFRGCKCLCAVVSDMIWHTTPHKKKKKKKGTRTKDLQCTHAQMASC